MPIKKLSLILGSGSRMEKAIKKAAIICRIWLSINRFKNRETCEKLSSTSLGKKCFEKQAPQFMT
jgi:hypothetical protein